MFTKERVPGKPALLDYLVAELWPCELEGSRWKPGTKAFMAFYGFLFHTDSEKAPVPA